MKRLIYFSAVVVAPACLCVLAAAYGAPEGDASPALPTTWPVNTPSNHVAKPHTGNDQPLTILMSAGKPQLSPRVVPTYPHPPHALPVVPFHAYGPGQSNHILGPHVQPTVPPGVYKTEPYSCIVVVPGPQADDRSIVNPGREHSSMPTIAPDLRFIPYRPRTNR